MTHKQRVLKIELHAESDEHLDHLLKLAIFEMEKIRVDFRNSVGDVLRRNMEGSAGKYSLEYVNSSQEVLAAIETLEVQGFQSQGMDSFDLYPIFRNPQTNEYVRILSGPVRVEAYDPTRF